MKIHGMLSLQELEEQVADETIETVLVVFTDLYGRFMGKRYDAEFFVEEVVTKGSHACDYLLTVDMGMNPVPGYKFANWELGYGDVHLVPDMSTLRMASWLEDTAMVLCDVFDQETGQPAAVAPRTILQQQIAAAQRAGFEAMGASELEYYVFEDSYREAARKNYHDLESVAWYIEDYHITQTAREEEFQAEFRRQLRRSGVPVENSKGEWGKGQHELNIRYAESLEMADRHSIYKQCLREVADQMDLSVTFMAKFQEDQAGSSCHIHLSLWRDDENAFDGEDKLGPIDCSEVFRWFLGGWMHHVPEMMVCYAPTVNSYKRYMSASWAPTRIAWSHDNRTAGFRVVGAGSSLRIECRIPGADCNPYLAYAAALASGLDGIANKIEPPTIFEGDIYEAQELPRVPNSLADAVELFAGSSFARESFGDEVVDHYSHFYRTEVQAYDSAVSDWERRRYFEQI